MGLLSDAIRQQQEGQRYYRQQSEHHAQTALKEVFDLLAEDEKRHEMILESVRGKLPMELRDDGTREKVAALFSGLEAQQRDIPAPVMQADVYKAAWEMEKVSVSLYEQLFDQEQDEQLKALYAFLIDQERMHMDIMETLYRFINRPNEWVEAAEFGLREEY